MESENGPMSSMHKELANVVRAAEMSGDMDVTRILNSAEFVGVNREKCINASQEFYGALVRSTGSEAGAIVGSVSDMDGVKDGRSSCRMFRVQRECMYPKALKDVSQVNFAIV